MNRRETVFALLALGAPPFVVQAQQPSKVWRISILQAGNRETNDRIAGVPFTSRLAELGYVVGRNLVIETRYADGKLDRLPELAAELIAVKPDLIFAPAAPASSAAKKLTSTIPIVFCYVNDPVALGFAQSLARPGGNLAGLSNFSSAVAGKRIELLKEIVPKLHRLCAWYSPDAVNDSIETHEVELAAVRLGVAYLGLKARNPADYDEAGAASRKWNADAIYVTSNPTNFTHRKQIINLVADLKKPASYTTTVFVEDGGLMSYSVKFQALARRAADYADRILRGANPGDLPVEQPTKLELAINLKTAKATGITFPQSVLLRADEVIQ